MKKHLLFLALLLAACNTAPPLQPPVSVRPGNLIEIQFMGSDAVHPTSQVLQSGLSGISKQELTEVSSGLSFKSLRTESLTTNGGRYLQATYLVTNRTGSTLSNLSFVPVVLSDTDGNTSNNAMNPTIAGTAFGNIKFFDGSDASGWASSLIPTYAMDYNSGTRTYQRDTTISSFKEHIYVDGYSITHPTGLEVTEVKPYGWTIQDDIANGATGQVTFSVFLPTTSPNSLNPYSFSVMAAYAQGVPDSTFDTTMSLNVNAGISTTQTSVAAGPNEIPFVAWVEDDHVYVKRWNGTGWTLLGSPVLTLSGSSPVSSVNIKVGPDNQPVVVIHDGNAATEQVLKWSGSSWNPLGGALASTGTSPAGLALDSSGNPVITHLSGNSVLAWEWMGSSWQVMRSSVDGTSKTPDQHPSVAMGTDNFPVVAWSEHFDGVWQLKVKKWSGSSWSDLGGVLNNSITQDASNVQLAAHGTTLFVTWEEAGQVYARTWDGSNWTLLGSAFLSDAGQTASMPTMAISPSGMPYVVYDQTDGLKLKSYDSENSSWTTQTLMSGMVGDRPWLAFSGDNPVVGWVNESARTSVRMDLTHTLLGERLDVNAGSESLQVRTATGPTGMPFVAWVEENNVYVKQWTGTQWTLLGSPATLLSGPYANHRISLKVGMDNHPIVLTHNGSTGEERVLKHNGSSWNQVGGALISNPLSTSSLALNSVGDPVVAHVTGSVVVVRQWTGTAWETLGSRVDGGTSSFNDHPSVVMGVDNLPVVAWGAYASGGLLLKVSKFNGSGWVALGGTLNVNTPADATSMELAARGNSIFVTWEESGFVHVKAWESADGQWWELGNLFTSDPGMVASNPSLAISPSGVPYLVHEEQGKIKLRRYDFTSGDWTLLPYTYSYATSGDRPSIAFSGDLPIVAWVENENIYVKR